MAARKAGRCLVLALRKLNLKVRCLGNKKKHVRPSAWDRRRSRWFRSVRQATDAAELRVTDSRNAKWASKA